MDYIEWKERGTVPEERPPGGREVPLDAIHPTYAKPNGPPLLAAHESTVVDLQHTLSDVIWE
jgi:hypothetical protein